MLRVHACFIQPTKKKILANTYLTPTTAVYVIPCKQWYFCKRYWSGALIFYLERGLALFFQLFMCTCTVEACKTVLSSHHKYNPHFFNKRLLPNKKSKAHAKPLYAALNTLHYITARSPKCGRIMLFWQN